MKNTKSRIKKGNAATQRNIEQIKSDLRKSIEDKEDLTSLYHRPLTVAQRDKVQRMISITENSITHYNNELNEHQLFIAI